VTPQCQFWLSEKCAPYTEIFNVQRTDVGPIVSDLLGPFVSAATIRKSSAGAEAGILPPDCRYEVALNSIAASPSRYQSVGYLYRWATMSSWDDFVEASELVQSMALTVAYSDSAGNVGYVITSEPLSDMHKKAADESQRCASLLNAPTDDEAGQQVCESLSSNPSRGNVARFNVINSGETMIFDDQRRFLLTPDRASRSENLAKGILSNSDSDASVESVMQALSAASSDVYSEWSLQLKKMILAIPVLDSENNLKMTKNRRRKDQSYYVSESADRIIASAQDLVVDFEGYLRAGHGRTAKDTGLPDSESIAATVVESFKMELLNALMSNPLGWGVNGVVQCPFPYVGADDRFLIFSIQSYISVND
jgi:acyl-homoserine lactone acylase PvdQ